MYIFRLLFSALIFFCSIAHAMHQVGTVALKGPSPEALAVLMDSLDVSHNRATQELALLMHSMSLRKASPSPKSKFEKIVDLAIQLNLCLIKDEGYFKEIESIAMEYFPKTESICATSKRELIQLTRETLKNIVRLTKNPSSNHCLLEQTIHQINSFKLKYMLSTHSLPLVIEDTTSRFKQEMLMALHG
jgi:hypothetical protein